VLTLVAELEVLVLDVLVLVEDCEVVSLILVLVVVVVTLVLVLLVDELLVADTVLGAVPPTRTIAELNGANQSFASMVLPASLGWTPSPVFSVVLYPVQQSTTLTGLAVVEMPAAHAGIAALSATTPAAQVVHPDGFIGVIWATRIVIAGF
jgi:hypothetical protein